MDKIIDKESVGSNSIPDMDSYYYSGELPDHFFDPLQQQQHQDKKTISTRNKEDDLCFKCNQKGHWANQCPNKYNNNNKTNARSTRTTSTDEEDVVEVMCPCGAGCCNIITSKTDRNPNRKFYRCPLPAFKACKFFKWCDELFLITGPAPACPCGAGLCSVFIHPHNQPQSARFPSSYSFVCPIKKGQGACNFNQPVNAITHGKGESSASVNTSVTPKSILTHCFSGKTTSATTSSVSSTSTISVNKIMVVEDQSSGISSHVVDKMQRVTNFEEQEEDSPEKVAGEEKEEGIPLHRHKRLRDWAPKKDDLFICDSGVDSNCNKLVVDLGKLPRTDTLAIKTSACVIKPDEILVQPQQQCLADFSYEIPCAVGATNLLLASPQSTCDRVSSRPIQNYLESTVLYNMLGFQVDGWCGRLLFPPSRSLTFPTSRPFFCCVFPSFDPIFVPEDDNRVDTEPRKLNGECGQLLVGRVKKVGPNEGCATQAPPGKLNDDRGQLSVSRVKKVGPSDGAATQAPPGKPNDDCDPFLVGRVEKVGRKGDEATTEASSGKLSPAKASILDVFKQAAESLEEGLIKVLESMKPNDHKSMVCEANLVFDALDNLSIVDYCSFKERVTGFISCAERLSELESSSSSAVISQEDVLLQEDKYIRVKMELEDISSQCLAASDALTASNDHLKFLTQEEARIREMLSCIQAEILCCREQNVEINNRLENLTQEKQKCETSVEVAKEEFERARRFGLQSKAQLDEAKGSFEKAWSKLRGSD